MLIVANEPLKLKPAKKKTLNLLTQLVKSQTLQRASEDFGRAEPSRSDCPVLQKSVCVLQGEYAEVDLARENVVIASTDATTCCIAALIAPREWALIAHLDERCCGQLAVLVPLLAARSGTAQLFLAGGYGQRGEAVTEELLQALHALPRLNVDVRLAAVGGLNQDSKSHNILHRDLAVDTATCTAWPAALHDRGPMVAMRSARPFSPVAGCMEPIYDAFSGHLRIPPVHLDTRSLDSAELLTMVELDDADLLAQSSTSPEQEGPGFCADVRATLRWMLCATGGRKSSAVFAWAEDSGGWKLASREAAAAVGGTKTQIAITL